MKLYIFFLSGIINLGSGKLDLIPQTASLPHSMLVYGPDESGMFDPSLICYLRWLYDQYRITQTYCICYDIERLPSFTKIQSLYITQLHRIHFLHVHLKWRNRIFSMQQAASLLSPVYRDPHINPSIRAIPCSALAEPDLPDSISPAP